MRRVGRIDLEPEGRALARAAGARRSCRPSARWCACRSPGPARCRHSGARPSRVGLGEAVEQAVGISAGDADAGVGHLDRAGASRSASGACWRTVTVTPPWAVNLMALDRKFSSTWRMRLASPTSGAVSPSQLDAQHQALGGGLLGQQRGHGAAPRRRRRTAAASSSTAPASSREKSSTLLTSSSRVALASRIRPAWRASSRGQPRASPASTPEKPMMALSGVRSSWVMLARKSDLAAAACFGPLAAPRPARAPCALRASMLRDTETTPASPCAAGRGQRETGLDPDDARRPCASRGTRMVRPSAVARQRSDGLDAPPRGRRDADRRSWASPAAPRA